MSSSLKSKKPNLLIHEASPYLQQHAYNPVLWHPWSHEVLQKARLERKPILLSIGYSSCHWCHVMEKESFENEEIAAFLNDNFICIKVDREERPDLDETFMEITCALNLGRGGWPMTVFLTPEQKPFFAGTYFPPYDSEGQMGFMTLITKLANTWKTQPENLIQKAKKLLKHLKSHQADRKEFPIGDQEITSCVRYYLKRFDVNHGGFGKSPKFPPYAALGLLLRYYKQTENAQILALVTETLDGIIKGGIYDHIGGGISRYSVDARWEIPHFEKMLYDNALLPPILLDAYLITGHPHYREAAEHILDFVLKELCHPAGGFYASLDADSEGFEGKYYTWQYAELKGLLTEDEWQLLKRYYHFSREGNWNRQIILNRLHLPSLAQDTHAWSEKEKRLLKSVKGKLLRARQNRPKPSRDDKIIVSWNALMISAFAKAGNLLNEERYQNAATKSADFILKQLTSDKGKVLRIYHKGHKQQPGFLEDYAFLAQAYLDLYEYGGAEKYLQHSLTTSEILLNQFRPSKSGHFATCSSEHDFNASTTQDGSDGVIPSPSAAAALTLARLSYHFDRPDLKQASIQSLSKIGRYIHDYPHLYASSLSVVDFHLGEPLTISCIGAGQQETFQNLLRELHKHYLPNKIVVHFNQSEKVLSASPMLQDKPALEGKPTVYICRDKSCLPPITDPLELKKELSRKEGDRQNIFGFLIPGKASVEKTKFYANCHSQLSFSVMGSTELSCSALGFGTYRVHEAEKSHQKALEIALLSGCNLIDTSSNYMDGSSEQCIGSVLRELIAEKKLSREEIILVSKAGYVQGKALELAMEKEALGTPYPDIVKISNHCWHCINPHYLEIQLHHSRARLQVDTIDFFLLHNPEYYFMDPLQNKAPLKDLRSEFYSRIEKAFTYLEEQVRKGYIQYYGVSSNTLADSNSSRQKTHFNRMWDIAQKIAGDEHHFRMIQLPLNLLESQASMGTEKILERAQEQKCAVLANRPLNAVYHHQMIRLGNFHLKEVPINFERHVKWGLNLEDEWKTSLAPFVQLPPDLPLPCQLFNWVQALYDLRSQRMNFIDWEDLENEQITPQLTYLFQLIEQHISRNTPLYNQWIDWKKRYLLALQPLIHNLRDNAVNLSAHQTREITDKINTFFPESKKHHSLSRKALWVATSTKGVTSVLNGMRSLPHVKDSLKVLEWGKLKDTDAVYQALQTRNLFKRSF